MEKLSSQKFCRNNKMCQLCLEEIDKIMKTKVSLVKSRDKYFVFVIDTYQKTFLLISTNSLATPLITFILFFHLIITFFFIKYLSLHYSYHEISYYISRIIYRISYYISYSIILGAFLSYTI